MKQIEKKMLFSSLLSAFWSLTLYWSYGLCTSTMGFTKSVPQASGLVQKTLNNESVKRIKFLIPKVTEKKNIFF